MSPPPSEPIRVITYNTAVGNKKYKTPQQDFLKLSIYREILEGEPGAAILAVQEVGPEQAQALKSAAAGGSSSFRVLHIERPGQGNALLIPARYRVLKHRSRYFVLSQLRALVAAAFDAVLRRSPFNRGQFFERRMWTEACVRDEASGSEFTVFNTHLSIEARLRLAQAKALLRRVHRSGRRGPVILAGDLNAVASTGKKPGGNPADAAIRALFPPLQDMATSARDPRRPPIDWILATGFEPVSSRLYTDGALSLPGIASAELLSDHYAKEAVLRLL